MTRLTLLNPIKRGQTESALNNKRLIEIADLATFAPLEQQDYQESLKDYWDLKSSMDTYYEEGKAAREKKIVRNGLKQGLDIQLITTLTGLSKDEIERIRDQR